MTAGDGRDYRDLVAWQRAIDFVELIYRVTADWPRDEKFGLTDQVRRAAVSIPANIAEGQGRNSAKEFLHFLGIANGSLREVETFLVIAARLGYCDKPMSDEVLHQAAEVGKPLRGLIRSLRD